MSTKPCLICTQDYRPVGAFALRRNEIGQSMHALSSLIAGANLYGHIRKAATYVRLVAVPYGTVAD